MANFRNCVRNSIVSVSEGSRTQARVQEFVKKLHPDVLRSRLRNFRKFVIATVSDRKSYARGETSSPDTTACEQAAHRPPPEECDCLPSGQDVSLWTRFYRKGSRSKQSLECQLVDQAHRGASDVEKADDRVDHDDMDLPVPEVVVQKEEVASSAYNNNRFESGSSHNLQLVIDVEAPSTRNKSPVTVQEWVDALPLTPNDSSR